MRCCACWALLIAAAVTQWGAAHGAPVCPLLDASGCCDSQCRVGLCAALYNFGYALVSRWTGMHKRLCWTRTAACPAQQAATACRTHTSRWQHGGSRQLCWTRRQVVYTGSSVLMSVPFSPCCCCCAGGSQHHRPAHLA